MTQRTQFDGASYLGQCMNTKCELYSSFSSLCVPEWNVWASFIHTSQLLSVPASIVKWVDIIIWRLSPDKLYGPDKLWSFAKVNNAGLERLSIEVSRCVISSMYLLGLSRCGISAEDTRVRKQWDARVRIQWDTGIRIQWDSSSTLVLLTKAWSKVVDLERHKKGKYTYLVVRI